MTVKEAIVQADGLRPNQYSQEDKLRWLSEVEYSILNDIIYQYLIPMPDWNKVNPFKPFKPFTEEDFDKELTAPFPFSRIYPAYIKMKIDEENQETQRYNVSAQMYNAYFTDYAKHINEKRIHLGKNSFSIY